jgi:hypothetical protein
MLDGRNNPLVFHFFEMLAWFATGIQRKLKFLV